MLEWLMQTAEQWNALLALFLTLGGGTLLELLRRFVIMRAWHGVWWFVETLGEVRNTLGNVQQAQTSQAEDVATIKQRLAGLTARQRQFLNRERDPIFETGLVGEVQFANRALIDLLEWPLDYLSGRGWEACIFVDDRARAVQEVDDAVEDKRFAVVRFRVVARSGRYFDVTCLIEPMICEANVITGFTGRFTDRHEIPPAHARA